jgi:hypothetical protein
MVEQWRRQVAKFIVGALLSGHWLSMCRSDMAILLHRSDCLVAINAADFDAGLDQASPPNHRIKFSVFP